MVTQIDFDKDFDEVSTWFKERWGIFPPKNLLPSTGYIARCTKTKELLSCGFLYLTNSPTFVLEYTATNPKSAQVKALRSLSYLLKFIKEIARKINPEAQIIQFLPNDKLAKFYEREGFKVTEKANLLHWA